MQVNDCLLSALSTTMDKGTKIAAGGRVRDGSSLPEDIILKKGAVL